MISQELLTALDDVLQAGSSAVAYLRSKVQDPALTNVVSQAELMMTSVRTADRTEGMMPQIVSTAKAAADQLVGVANQVGETGLAQDLKARASKLSSVSWLTIIGLAAGAFAIYYLWFRNKKAKALAVFEAPDPVDERPRLQGMSRALGSFKSLGSTRKLGGCRPALGSGGKKYQFEPESSLEGYRRKPRRSTSRSSR